MQPDQPLPYLKGDPFRAVVIIEASVTSERRNLVSAWLVKNGCLYMMAWGLDCSLWDDGIDCTNLGVFEYGVIPDGRFVMTTWHDKEPLYDVFQFCEHMARHPTVDLDRIILVHISPANRNAERLSGYQSACRAD